MGNANLGAQSSAAPLPGGAIANVSISDAELAANAVTAGKIASGAVTAGKLAAGAVAVVDLAAAVQALLVPVGAIVAHGGTVAPTGWLLCDGGQHSRSTYPSLDAALTTGYGEYTNGAGASGTSHFRVPDMRGRVGVGVGAGAGLSGYLRGDSGGNEAVSSHSHDLSNHTHPMAHDHTMAHVHGMAHTHTMKSHTHTVNVSGVSGGAAGITSFFSPASTGPARVLRADLNTYDHTHGFGASGTTAGPNDNTTDGSSAGNTGDPSAPNTGGSSAENTGVPGLNSSGLAGALSLLQPYLGLNYIIKF